MSILLDGKKLANKINENTKKEIKRINSNPNLVAIQVGENAESELYIKNKANIARQVGVIFTYLKFDAKISNEKLLEKINELNANNSVDGIMVQLPLPSHLDEKIISQTIAPWKDVDGFHPLNKGLLDINYTDLIPPTAKGVIELLDEYKIDVKGKKITVIGQGEIAGKPISKILINREATVTICNKETKNLHDSIIQSDIVISAVGLKHLVKADDIKQGAVVINIGVTKDETGIHGDIEFEKMLNKASYITPITGGTGPMTVAILIKNVLLCHKINNRIS